MDVERPLDRYMVVLLDVAQFILAREEAGHTQSSLARRAGVSQSTVNHIEQGTKNPSIATATKLAKALGVDLETLKGDGAHGAARKERKVTVEVHDDESGEALVTTSLLGKRWRRWVENNVTAGQTATVTRPNSDTLTYKPNEGWVVLNVTVDDLRANGDQP